MDVHLPTPPKKAIRLSDTIRIQWQDSKSDAAWSFALGLVVGSYAILEAHIPAWFGITNSQPLSLALLSDKLAMPTVYVAFMLMLLATGAGNLFALQRLVRFGNRLAQRIRQGLAIGFFCLLGLSVVALIWSAGRVEQALPMVFGLVRLQCLFIGLSVITTITQTTEATDKVLASLLLFFGVFGVLAPPFWQ